MIPVQKPEKHYFSINFDIHSKLQRFSMATKSMNDSWARVVTQIETIWNTEEFGDKEMKKARGNLSKMVNLIHDKTGEPKAEIIQKISAFL